MGGIFMNSGYDNKLFILAFDHRGSFQKKWFGLEGEPTDEDTRRISDAKHLVFEGLLHALDEGAEAGSTGALVDEQFGAPTNIPGEAKERGLKLAMPVEKSGQNEFDFEYGDDFGAHIEEFDPDFSKVLVRYNPDDPDTDMNRRQLDRLKRLADWLHAHDRKFLFELLVPATDDQLARVDGDSDRYDAELRPELMRRAIQNIQGAGIEVDIWKIEGVEERSDAEMLAEQTRVDGRDDVRCVLLGRGASDEKVDQWLSQAAPVEGFIGFAIGRSIWGDPLKGFLDGSLERSDAARQIGENYLRFVKVYEESEATVAGR
jgi:myo-inositol catabolism protein IolC